MRAAFRTPGFGRLYAGLGASMFGDSLMLIVLSMWVKTLTGSNGAAGATFLAMTAPALLAPLLGYVVDRVPRRTVPGGRQRAVRAGDAAAAAGPGRRRRVDRVRRGVLLRHLLRRRTRRAQRAAQGPAPRGRPGRGQRLAVGAPARRSGWSDRWWAPRRSRWPAAASWRWPTRRPSCWRPWRWPGCGVEEHRDEPREPQHWRVEVLEGASFIRRTPLLLHTTMALALALLVIGFAESAVYAVVEAFGHPVSFVGPLLTVQGVGAVSVGPGRQPGGPSVRGARRRRGRAAGHRGRPARDRARRADLAAAGHGGGARRRHPADLRRVQHAAAEADPRPADGPGQHLGRGAGDHAPGAVDRGGRRAGRPAGLPGDLRADGGRHDGRGRLPGGDPAGRARLTGAGGSGPIPVRAARDLVSLPTPRRTARTLHYFAWPCAWRPGPWARSRFSSASSTAASSMVGALPPYDAGSHQEPGGCSSAG